MHEALGSIPSTARNKEEKNEELWLWRAYGGRDGYQPRPGVLVEITMPRRYLQ